MFINKMASIVRKIIQTNLAPKAIGPYSQAVLVNDTLYVSGQLGLDPNTGELASGGIEAEARQALQNMGAILKAAGGDFGNVVKTTVLLANMDHFANVNNIYKECKIKFSGYRFLIDFKEPFPARAAYQVAQLPKKGLVEIECVAVIGQITDTQ